MALLSLMGLTSFVVFFRSLRGVISVRLQPWGPAGLLHTADYGAVGYLLHGEVLLISGMIIFFAFIATRNVRELLKKYPPAPTGESCTAQRGAPDAHRAFLPPLPHYIGQGTLWGDKLLPCGGVFAQQGLFVRGSVCIKVFWA